MADFAKKTDIRQMYDAYVRQKAMAKKAFAEDGPEAAEFIANSCVPMEFDAFSTMVEKMDNKKRQKYFAVLRGELPSPLNTAELASPLDLAKLDLLDTSLDGRPEQISE